MHDLFESTPDQSVRKQHQNHTYVHGGQPAGNKRTHKYFMATGTCRSRCAFVLLFFLMILLQAGDTHIYSQPSYLQFYLVC